MTLLKTTVLQPSESVLLCFDSRQFQLCLFTVKQHKSQFSELLARTRRRLQEQRETPERPTDNSSGATECPQTEHVPACCDSDTTLYTSPMVIADRVLTDSEDSEHMVSDWELCDDRASPCKDATSSEDDELAGDSDHAISDGSLCVRPFKDATSSDDDRPAITDSQDWVLRSSPDITSSDDDQPLKTSVDAEITELNIGRDHDDGDADSDATVGVGIGADEEREREMRSDEMTRHETEEVRDGVKTGLYHFEGRHVNYK